MSRYGITAALAVTLLIGTAGASARPVAAGETAPRPAAAPAEKVGQPLVMLVCREIRIERRADQRASERRPPSLNCATRWAGL